MLNISVARSRQARTALWVKKVQRVSRTVKGYTTRRNWDAKQSHLEELPSIKTDLSPCIITVMVSHFTHSFLMEPNPMATSPVSQIKEVNHPGDDMWAFQVKEQFLKNGLKKYSVSNLQAFPGNFGWPGLVSSPCIHCHRSFLGIASTYAPQALLRADCAMCSFSNWKKTWKNVSKGCCSQAMWTDLQPLQHPAPAHLPLQAVERVLNYITPREGEACSHF